MDHMMINENKIKLVTGVAGAYFTMLHLHILWCMIMVEFD